MGEREGGRGGRGIGEEQKEVEMSRRGKERNRETRLWRNSRRSMSKGSRSRNRRTGRKNRSRRNCSSLKKSLQKNDINHHTLKRQNAPSLS